MVYLLHFTKPIGSDNPHGRAQHYIGYAEDLERRIAEHRAGNGARLPQVFAERGIDFVVARTWEGDRTLERRLKNWKKARQLCPICDARALGRANL